MKVQFIFNKVKNKSLAHLGIAQYKTELEKIGYTADVSFRDTDKTFNTYQFSSDVVGNAQSIREEEIGILMENGHRLSIFILGSGSSSPEQSNPVQLPLNKNGNTAILIPEHWYGAFADVLTEYLLHETAHAGFFFSGKKDTVHVMSNRDINPTEYDKWIVKGAKAYYLHLLTELKPFLETTPQITKPTPMTYKYFSPKEIVGLKPDFVKKLDDARGIAGFPFVIVSGFRTPQVNKAVGGVADSSHLSGYGADLRCDTSEKMYKMLTALQAVGFNRFGINKTTIHVDCDPTKSKNVIWTYYK